MYIKKWLVPHELLSEVAVAEAELEELVLSTLVAFFALFYLIAIFFSLDLVFEVISRLKKRHK